MTTDAKRDAMLAAIAAIYDESADVFADNTAMYRERRWTEDHDRFIAGIPLHGRVLDLGFGSGWDMRYFHSRGYEVAGIDISRRQVVRARESLPYADVHLGDIARADECFSLESFDGIWACAAIVHIDRIQAEKTFHSMYRLLRPGGSAYVSVKCRSDVNAPEIVEKPSRSSDGIVKRYIYWLPEDLFAALRSTWFSVDSHGYSSMNSGDTFVNIFIHKP